MMSEDRETKYIRISALVFIAWVVGVDARASRSDWQECVTAAEHAARAHGIPENIFLALTLTETGRAVDQSVRPWPWAINVEGRGAWLDNRDTLVAAAEEELRTGNRNFDLGCFQLNYRWHSAGFQSIGDMIDPAQNAEYAAQFLAGHYAATGDWETAVGRFHSVTPELAEQYLARFRRLAAVDVAAEVLSEITAPPEIAPSSRTANAYPLLQVSGGVRRLGSLVPISLGGS